MMHVLVTRPLEDALEMKAALTAAGITATIAPLLEIAFEDIHDTDLSSVQAIIFTSRNGVRSLYKSRAFNSARDIPVYAVGPGTARLALDLGLTDVIQGPGTAEALCEMISQQRTPATGTLLHFAGRDLAFDSKGALEAQDFQVREITAYRALPIKELPPQALDALSGNEVNGVVLMSPRSARTFANIIDREQLQAAARRLHYFCLSQSVVDALKSSIAETISVASRPDAEEMLALITRFAPKY